MAHLHHAAALLASAVAGAQTTKNEVLILSARIDALKQQGKGESDKNVKRLTQDQTKHQVNL